MERSQNPRTARGRRVQFVDAAPQDRSRSGPDVHRLQSNCDSAHWRNESLQGQVDKLIQEKSDLLINKKRICKTLHNYKWQINRLEGLLELRETEFKTEFKNSYETISSFEAQVSSLEKQLQSQKEEMDRIQLLRKNENNEMAARLETEKRKLQKSVVLQSDLQQKLNQMEQQLHQKDKEILDLRKNNDDLSHRLTKVSTECLQSNNAWQTKYNALQEKFTEELATKQQSCEATEEQLAEEKKKLEELHLRINNEKKEKVQEMKNKDKEEIDRLSQKLKDATKELTSCRVEFLQTYKAWQGEYNALEDKFREQLIHKDQDWEKKFKLVEDEKTSLVQKVKDWEKKCELLEDEKNDLVQKEQDWERKVKLVEDEKNSLVQIEQDLERSQEEGNEETAGTLETQKEEKKKGFLSWMHKKKKCDSQTEVEEAPCCSTQVAQQ